MLVTTKTHRSVNSSPNSLSVIQLWFSFAGLNFVVVWKIWMSGNTVTLKKQLTNATKGCLKKQKHSVCVCVCVCVGRRTASSVVY